MPIQSKDTVNERYRTRMFIEVYIKSKNIQSQQIWIPIFFSRVTLRTFLSWRRIPGPIPWSVHVPVLSASRRRLSWHWLRRRTRRSSGSSPGQTSAEEQPTKILLQFCSFLSNHPSIIFGEIEICFECLFLYRFCVPGTTWKMFNLHHACNKTCIETS